MEPVEKSKVSGPIARATPPQRGWRDAAGVMTRRVLGWGVAAAGAVAAYKGYQEQGFYSATMFALAGSGLGLLLGSDAPAPGSAVPEAKEKKDSGYTMIPMMLPAGDYVMLQTVMIPNDLPDNAQSWGASLLVCGALMAGLMTGLQTMDFAKLSAGGWHQGLPVGSEVTADMATMKFEAINAKLPVNLIVTGRAADGNGIEYTRVPDSLLTNQVTSAIAGDKVTVIEDYTPDAALGGTWVKRQVYYTDLKTAKRADQLSGWDPRRMLAQMPLAFKL